jgi:hypothetical protein
MVGNVLGMSDQFDWEKPLNLMGMDSLLAMELRSAFESAGISTITTACVLNCR